MKGILPRHYKHFGKEKGNRKEMQWLFFKLCGLRAMSQHVIPETGVLSNFELDSQITTKAYLA